MPIETPCKPCIQVWVCVSRRGSFLFLWGGVMIWVSSGIFVCVYAGGEAQPQRSDRLFIRLVLGKKSKLVCFQVMFEMWRACIVYDWFQTCLMSSELMLEHILSTTWVCLLLSKPENKKTALGYLATQCWTDHMMGYFDSACWVLYSNPFSRLFVTSCVKLLHQADVNCSVKL